MSPGIRTSRAIAIGLLTLLAIAWGAIPLFVRAEIPPSHLVAMRVTLGAVVLVLFSMATSRFAIPRLHWRGVVLLGTALAAHWLSFFVALNLTTVAVTLAILYIGPVLAAILSGPVLNERVSRHAYTGLAVAVVGTLFVIRPGSGATVAGVVVAAISGVLLAVIMLLGKLLAAGLGGLVVATWELVVASVVIVPFTVQAVRESGEYWPQFVVLGAIFTGLAGVVFWTSMRRLPVAMVSVIMYLEPASAVVWAALFLGEQPDLLTWSGVILVVAAGTIATQGMPDEEAVGIAETL
ncbi:MAG: DMT family transporter [Actinomycetota bacterium]|nr:DMT family transporter [Actinomycetota bacterium]